MKLYDILEPESKKHKNTDKIVGIDLGTTNSLVSIFEDGKFKRISSRVPSRVILKDNKLSLDYNKKEGAIESFKRLMGKSLEQVSEQDRKIHNLVDGINGVEILTREGRVSPIEASSCILSELLSKAKSYDSEINKAVVTVPAYFDLNAREATIKAAKIAGLDVLRIVSEPTAAAIAYGLDSLIEGIFAIYDLGGGTFDVSILKLQQGLLRVVATVGDNYLGGDDIDLLITEYIAGKCGLGNLSQAELVFLKQIARSIKEKLSVNDSVCEEFNIRNKQYNIELDSIELVLLAKDLIQKTIDLFDSCLKDAKISLSQLNGIVLVGGSSKLAIVHELIAENYPGKPIYNSFDPEEVVAFGAALYANNLLRHEGNVLVDVLPISIGLELMGGLNEKIIIRNQAIPCSFKKIFTTYQDGQDGMIFNIFQGEREFVADCRLLANMELKNLPAKKAGMVKIEVEFAIDQDGVLKISAKDMDTNNQITAELNPIFGINKEDIQSMIDESYQKAGDDINKKRLIENRLKFQMMMIKLREVFVNYPEFLYDEDRKKMSNLNETDILLMEDPGALETIVREVGDFAEELASRQLSFYLSKKIIGKNISDIREIN